VRPTGEVVQRYSVLNFANAIGTAQADELIGNVQDNRLDGGEGDDLLQGTSTSKGLKERDILTGGGYDRFVGGTQDNPFYVDPFSSSDPNGKASFATITDLSFGDQIQLAAGQEYLADFADDGITYTIKQRSTLANGTIYDNLIIRATFTGGTSAIAKTTAGLDSIASPAPQGAFTLVAEQSLGIIIGA
jgi:hypothetical protein